MANIFSLPNLINQKLEETTRHIDFLKNTNYNYLNIELNQHQQEIIYQTPYCLQIAKHINKTPLSLANKIVNKFNQIRDDQDLIARVSGQGWLEFIIGDRLVEKYLNSLNETQIIPISKIKEKKIKKKIPFIKYYLHSRCYSLLRSGHYQEIIQLNNLDFILNQWQIIQPKNKHFSIFYTSKYPEQIIIKEILLIVEKIKTKKISNNQALNKLEKLFFEIESNSRIWGITLQQNSQLSQTRLALIGLILHCYQNIFYSQYQQQINVD